MINHGEGKLIKPNTTKPSPIGTNLNNFLVPAIKNTMQLNIHNFPSKFPCSISPIFNKTFPLFDKINNFAPYRETLDNPFHFVQDIFIVLTLLHVLGDDFGLEFVLEQGDTFSTALLRDHKLITIYLLEIGILLRVCLLGEIQSHTFQYLTRQRSNILVQLPMQS